MKIRKIEVATKDSRGTISDILYKEEINHVAIIETTNGGVIRGNHYHKESTQHIFMTKGSLRYWYKHLDSGAPARSILVEEFHIVTTPPLEVHALEMIEPSQFIVFTSGIRGGVDYESDTFREITILTPDMIKK
jgi:dTDP-4-dehydrorhamnose 3,5-epimerase-like enzyme